MNSEPTNRIEIRVIGMSRSGNHLLVNWILDQVRGRYCFVNCAEGKADPFASARPLDDGRRILTNVPHLEPERDRNGRFAARDYLLHSYEDSYLAHCCSRWFDHEHDRLVGTSGRRIDVLVLRDPFNLFASRSNLSSAKLPGHTMVRMWKQHAKAILHGSPHLRQETVGVSYNAFVRSARYRREIARSLGLGAADPGIEEVARCAGGSSFDGTAFDGEAWRMPVFARWRHCIGDPSYRALFDPETVRLARRIFPDEELPYGERWTEATPACPVTA